MSPELTKQLGWQDKEHPTKMAQADGTSLEARRMVSTQFAVAGRRIRVNAKVLDLGGERQLILGLSWLRKNGFVINPMNRSLDNVGKYLIKCTELQLPRITPIDSMAVAVNEGDLVMVLDAVTEYAQYQRVFSTELANRRPPHRKWDHEIELQPEVKIPNGVTYKVTM